MILPRTTRDDAALCDLKHILAAVGKVMLRVWPDKVMLLPAIRGVFTRFRDEVSDRYAVNPGGKVMLSGCETAKLCFPFIRCRVILLPSIPLD